MTDSTPIGGNIEEAARAKAAEVAGQAQQLGESLEARATEEAGVRSTQVGEQIGAVGEVMHEASRELRDRGNPVPAAIADQVAVQADRFGRYLRESSGEKIMKDVQDFAREQPWMVAALAFAAGLAAARLLKASGRRGYSGASGASPTPTAATPSPPPELPSPTPVQQTSPPPRPAIHSQTVRPEGGGSDV